MREKPALKIEGTHRREAVADGSSRSPQVSKAGFGSTMAAATGHTVAGLLAAACVATACSAGAALHFLPPTCRACTRTMRSRACGRTDLTTGMCMPHARTHEPDTCSRTH